ncbi:MAG: TonB-dependent receptor plug domain-containing protein [Betaproteobacteria bacterium]|nr:TonB-dependent receptor plug domain-containing protein [Betaproteobacteria bacterium]
MTRASRRAESEIRLPYRKSGPNRGHAAGRETVDMPKGHFMSRTSCLTVFALSVPCTALAADAGVFHLGTVLVTAKRPEVGEILSEQVSSVVTADEIRRFDRPTVSDALNLLSGIAVTSNVRNEQTVYMRGYDPRQTPLFIDGIPVYVPYDGYVDFGRFATADLSGIQVAKGFSSVAYGPNTLGGAINLISRRPSRELEGDVTVGIGQGNAHRADANVGSRHERWYVQAGVSYRDADGFRMSSDFSPPPQRTAIRGITRISATTRCR